MTEKITVRIGKRGSLSREGKRTLDEDIQFLREAFNISTRRANDLNQELRTAGARSCSGFAHVILTYSQLGKYVALRRIHDLHQYWRYPHVVELIEEPEDKPEIPTIELRPGYRL